MKFKDIRPNKNETLQDYMKRLFDEMEQTRKKVKEIGLDVDFGISGQFGNIKIILTSE